MSLVTRRMRKHAYQLERRATDFPRKFCRATKFPSDRISCDTGTTLLRSCLCRSAVVVRPFAHLRILYAGPGCKSGPAGFKASQAFTAVYNRASRLYSRPARFKTGRPAIKPAAGFQAGQVYYYYYYYYYENFTAGGSER